MKQTLSKRICGMVLVFIMAVSAFVQYPIPAREVHAETGAEPVYDTASDILRYSKDAMDVPAGGDFSFGTTALPTTETCYVSFEVQTEDSLYLDFYGKGAMARAYLLQKQYGMLAFEKEVWPQGNFGLSDGVRITYSQGPEGISLWMNGQIKHENLKPVSNENGNAPRVRAGSKTVSLKNIKIWAVSDEPKFDNACHVLNYDRDAVDVAANGAFSFGTTALPTTETCYVSFEVQTEDSFNMDIYGKGGMARIWFLQSQYVLVNFTGGDQYISGNIGLSKGVKVTYSQGPEGISIWINGIKTKENQKPTTTESPLAPRVRAGSKPLSLKNIKTWSEKAFFIGASLTLNDDIDINFYLRANGVLSDNVTAKAAMAGGMVKELPKTEWILDEATGCYKISADVAAKEMTKEVTVAVYDGEALLAEHSYSVKAYADAVLAKPDEYAAAVPLVKAMLNYGANAQVYFAKGQDTGTLANEALDASDKDVSAVTPENLSAFAPSNQKNEKMAVAGASLILESKTTLKVFLKFEEGIKAEDYEAVCNGTPLNMGKNGSYICVLIENIDAANLDTNYKVVLTNKNDSADVFRFTYSPMTYSYNVLKGEYADTLKTLVRSLYLYNVAAKQYRAAQ